MQRRNETPGLSHVTLLGIYQLTHGSRVGRFAPSVVDGDSGETSAKLRCSGTKLGLNQNF